MSSQSRHVISAAERMRRLATKQELWAIAFLWATFTVIGFFTIYKEPLDPGGWLRLPVAMGFGALGLIFAVAIMGAFEIVTGWLPRKIAYQRLSPIEQFAFRINSRTETGLSERAALEKRLVKIASSELLRETLYHDPLNDQFWLSVYWQQDHYDGEDLKPLDERQKDQALRRFEQARDV